MIDKIWEKPGDIGHWTSPSGARLWLASTDHPMTRTDGRLVLVRVRPPSAVSVLSLVRLEKQVLVADPEGGAFRFAGRFGLEASGGFFVRGVTSADSYSTEHLPGSVETAEEAVLSLVEHAASKGLPPAPG